MNSSHRRATVSDGRAVECRNREHGRGSGNGRSLRAARRLPSSEGRITRGDRRGSTAATTATTGEADGAGESNGSAGTAQERPVRKTQRFAEDSVHRCDSCFFQRTHAQGTAPTRAGRGARGPEPCHVTEVVRRMSSGRYHSSCKPASPHLEDRTVITGNDLHVNQLSDRYTHPGSLSRGKSKGFCTLGRPGRKTRREARGSSLLTPGGRAENIEHCPNEGG